MIAVVEIETDADSFALILSFFTSAFYIGGNGSWSDWQDEGGCSSPCGPGMARLLSILKIMDFIQTMFFFLSLKVLTMEN